MLREGTDDYWTGTLAMGVRSDTPSSRRCCRSPCGRPRPPSPIRRSIGPSRSGTASPTPGNVYVATGTFTIRPFEPIAAAPYLIGRFHFTNGPTWIEQLARDLGLRRSARPALLGRPGFTNYAFGSARARPVGGFDLDDQVDLFLADFDGEASPGSLYAVFIGSNDLRDAFVELIQGNEAGAEQIVREAVGGTAVAIQRLADAGAIWFLVLNLPDIANTPSVRELGPEAELAANALSQAYNLALAEALAGLQAFNPQITIVDVDVFTALEDVVAHPRKFRLRNVTDSCITPGVIFGAICRRPDKYLFWDFIHPSKRGHQLLSEEALDQLEDAVGHRLVRMWRRYPPRRGHGGRWR